MSSGSEATPESTAQIPAPRGRLRRGAFAVFGGEPQGARLERIRDSPHFDGVRFQNAVETPTARPSASLLWEVARGGAERTPDVEIPIVRPPRGSLHAGQGEALRVTWLGHSTVLLEIDGKLVLTDPVFGPRTAPVSWMGPKRFHAPPLEPEQLPELDLILVSHDHFDHLDFPTIKRLAGRDTPWVTSLGVGAHLEAWGVPPARITELDWWQAQDFAGLRVTATPARHFQGRGPAASKATFWSSWAIQGPRHSVWFSGDTGAWDEGFAEIGERFGGFDLSMIEVGAYHPSWGTIHLGPDNAMRVHELVRAKTMMPVHWGTFPLALHAWDQPVRRVQELAEQSSVQLLSPIMGHTVHREAGVDAFWLGRR